MLKQFYFTCPVEVVKVTAANINEVAEWCGGEIGETPSRRTEGRMDKYVWVPTPKGSTTSWAFPGMFVTRRIVLTTEGKFKETWSVFRRDYFEKNYFETPLEAVDGTWEKFIKHQKSEEALEELRDYQESLKPSPTANQQITVNVYGGQDPKEVGQLVSEAVSGKSYLEQLVNTPQEA